MIIIVLLMDLTPSYVVNITHKATAAHLTTRKTVKEYNISSGKY